MHFLCLQSKCCLLTHLLIHRTHSTQFIAYISLKNKIKHKAYAAVFHLTVPYFNRDNECFIGSNYT